MPTKPNSVPRADEVKAPKLHKGSHACTMNSLVKMLDNPDTPIAESGGLIAKKMGAPPVAPSKMFEDAGHKLAVVGYLGSRARSVRMPATAEGVFSAMEAFFEFCFENTVPVTWGLFCVWCGTTMSRMNQIERNPGDERSHAIGVCKETIRQFLELAAMDNTMNPILLFHMNKTQYGFVENQSVTLRIENNEREITDEEFDARIGMLVDVDPSMVEES